LMPVVSLPKPIQHQSFRHLMSNSFSRFCDVLTHTHNRKRIAL
jgi:hypothetical protein